MNGYVHYEMDALYGINSGSETAGLEHSSYSTGTFSLRRAEYFIETWTQLFSADQLCALTKLIPENDPVAKQRIIVHNLRKVVGIAKRYSNRGLAFSELLSEGMLGFIHAMEKFELEGGFRFSVYATRCICRNIERALTNRNNPLESFQTARPSWIPLHNASARHAGYPA